VSATVEEHPLGISWISDESTSRTAHAVVDAGHVWLIDPFEDAAALGRTAELGEPVGVIQLLDRHARDCQAIASRLGVPLLRLPRQLPGTPFEVIKVLDRRGWREVALWWPEQAALIVAEAVGSAPLFAVGPGRVGVHPLLRLTPPRAQLGGYEPRSVLVGHGHPVDRDAARELGDALSRARRDIPRLLMKLPTAIRGR
jgi:hypothetical protein